jgi:murein DD-endopeptidase MepM/ murein hydrolase activator NlpD
VSGIVRLAVALALLVGAAGVSAEPSDALRVVFHPARLTVGHVGWVHVLGAGDTASLDGSIADVPLTFFPYGGGHAALIGIDLETEPGPKRWRVAARQAGREASAADGGITVLRRDFPLQRLTLPGRMVDLDPETKRRAESESERLRAVFRTITDERLWHGAFARPIDGARSGTGFGARRIINGQPRRPHSGIDFAAPAGTPVGAANAGRVALVGDFFFPGRLVVLDHGLGLYTLYFHLDRVLAGEGEKVDRGQTIGTVGATGRATGPHLHFGAQVGPARIDPAALLELSLRD